MQNNKNILDNFHNSIYTATTSKANIINDFLSPVIDIISPNIRAVSVSVLSEDEKKKSWQMLYQLWQIIILIM